MFKDLKSYDDLKKMINLRYSLNSLTDLKFLLLSKEENKRKTACEFTKGVLDDLLTVDEDVVSHEVTIINLHEEKTEVNGFESCAIKEAYKQGRVFIPIFHNTDDKIHYPLFAWDACIPALFSLTQEGYRKLCKLNDSKTSCFYTLDLDKIQN